MTNEKIKLHGLELYIRRIEPAKSREVWLCQNLIDGKVYIQCSPELTPEEIKDRVEKSGELERRHLIQSK